MRILVHDYSGHPFQAQLSRELARRGHNVWHVTSADFQSPKGRLDADPDLGNRLVTRNLSLGEVFQKDSFFRRRSQEVAFGKLVGQEILAVKPDVVLSSNAPLDTQRGILRATRAVDARFVFWVQDLYGEAIGRILKTKFGPFGQAVGAYYRGLEYSMLRASDMAVVISPDFTPILTANGVPSSKVVVIENWAPLDDNPYSAPGAKPAGASMRLVYAGTLGYKHDPELLILSAEIPGVEVAVFSEGRVADEVRRRGAELPMLSVQGWTSFEQLPATLASADVLLAMIEADAGIFSVPSKILTYLCTGRPIVASIPEQNLAARILTETGAGLVSRPGDTDAFLNNVRKLLADPALRDEMGRRARAYAEQTFAIDRIAERFEDVLSG